jgi:hypothetical protein
MSTKMMKWVFISVLLLALLWPSSAGHLILLGSAVCVGAIIWGGRASRAGKHLWGTGHEMVPRKVKFEN